MIAPAASGVSSPTTSAGAGGELGDAREPRVQDAGLHAEAREPARGALDLAAPVDVVVAVGDHRRRRPRRAGSAARARPDPRSRVVRHAMLLAAALGGAHATGRPPLPDLIPVVASYLTPASVIREPRATPTDDELRPVRGVQPQRRHRRRREPVPDVRPRARRAPDQARGLRRRGDGPRRRRRHRALMHDSTDERRRVHRVRLRRGAAGAEGRRDVLVGGYADIMGPVFGHSILEMDEPEHHTYRGLVQQAFSRKAMETWERDLVRGVVDEHSTRSSTRQARRPRAQPHVPVPGARDRAACSGSRAKTCRRSTARRSR